MSFRPARANNHHLSTRTRIATGSFEDGSLLEVNGSGEYAECGADPSDVSAIALHPVGTGSGALYPIGYKEFPPGKCIGHLVDINQTFTAEYVGTIPAVPTGDYGVTKGADGKWRVDFAKTGGSARVRVVNLLTETTGLDIGRVEVKFLAAALVSA